MGLRSAPDITVSNVLLICVADLICVLPCTPCTGIYAYAWPLPLTVDGVGKAQMAPGPPPAGSAFIGPPAGWPNVALSTTEPKSGRERKRGTSAAVSDEEPAVWKCTLSECMLNECMPY